MYIGWNTYLFVILWINCWMLNGEMGSWTINQKNDTHLSYNNMDIHYDAIVELMKATLIHAKESDNVDMIDNILQVFNDLGVRRRLSFGAEDSQLESTLTHTNELVSEVEGELKRARETLNSLESLKTNIEAIIDETEATQPSNDILITKLDTILSELKELSTTLTTYTSTSFVNQIKVKINEGQTLFGKMLGICNKATKCMSKESTSEFQHLECNIDDSNMDQQRVVVVYPDNDAFIATSFQVSKNTDNICKPGAMQMSYRGENIHTVVQEAVNGFSMDNGKFHLYVYAQNIGRLENAPKIDTVNRNAMVKYQVYQYPSLSLFDKFKAFYYWSDKSFRDKYDKWFAIQFDNAAGTVSIITYFEKKINEYTLKMDSKGIVSTNCELFRKRSKKSKRESSKVNEKIIKKIYWILGDTTTYQTITPSQTLENIATTVNQQSNSENSEWSAVIHLFKIMQIDQNTRIVPSNIFAENLKDYLKDVRVIVVGSDFKPIMSLAEKDLFFFKSLNVYHSN